MRTVRDLPIRRKLALIDIVTTAAALLLACGAFVVVEQVSFRRTMVRDLSITAKMLATNATSALSFDDANSAEETLQALAAQPHIVAACIYRLDGRVFATYRRDAEANVAWPAPQRIGESFDHMSLRLFRSITLADEPIGTIYLQSDLGEIDARWRHYAVIAATAMAIATILTFLLGRRLQRLISVPISRLSEAIAGAAAPGSRYSVRAVKMGNDELGQLTDGFNHMLEQIQAREDDLRKAQAELESRVVERTRELSIQIAERQRTEEERDRFFTLSPDLFCIANFDGVMRRTNPAFESLGFTAMQLEDMTYLDLVDAEDRDTTRAELEKLATGHVLRNYEVRMRTAGGVPRWFAWSIKSAPDACCFFACGRDITEQKRADVEREALHRQLVDISRQAGMAEVATSVLHNVGNVLNSVNVSATLVGDKLRNSRIPLLAEVSALLDQHQENLPKFLAQDPRGRRVPHFLQTLAHHLVHVQTTVVDEMQSLRKNIDHIKEIVAMQQSYARVSGVTETVDVAQLVEDAVQMNAGGFDLHGIVLERQFAGRPSITVEKHKVLQILVNIIRNAKLACAESGRSEKRITLRIRDAENEVHIEVADNGVGIAPENLTRIFNHGFTTRAAGHGFGLHSGALAVRELGGVIRAHSSGKGHGAVFTVVLPHQPRGKRS